MDKSIKSLHHNLAEWLAGPTGSVCLHVALILALIFLVDFARHPDDPVEIEVTYLDVKDMPAAGGREIGRASCRERV